MTEPILELEFEKVERLEKELLKEREERKNIKQRLDEKLDENERLKAELAKYQNS